MSGCPYCGSSTYCFDGTDCGLNIMIDKIENGNLGLNMKND